MNNILAITNEKELLLRLRNGDERAFEQIYHRYKRRIYYNVLKLVRAEDITAELHQDIFLKLWENRNKLDIERPIEALLVMIAKNTAIDFYRKASRDRSLREQLLSTMNESHDPIGALIDYKETSEAIEKAISKLPQQRQRVFRLIKMEHKSYEFAATLFGVSIGTIKDHMAKASRFLQHELSSSSDVLLLFMGLSVAVVGG